jgi:polyhydroxyalkanoate synthesis regulator phasin
MINLSEELKKIFLAGVGAVAITAEKSKEVVDELVKKGELTVEQGKVLNEELKRNVKKKVRDVVSNPDDNLSELNIINKLDQMSAEQLQAIKAKIAELENPKK